MATDDLHPIRLGFPSHGGGSLPVWAASRLGIFRRNGLDVGQTLLLGSVNVVEALLAGEVQFANMASPAVVEANVRLAEADLVYLASARVRIAQQFIGTPEITGIADLRGRKVGARSSPVDRFTDLDSTLWRYVLTRAGMDPATDVEYVEIDSHADLVDALAAGRVQAGLVVPPYAFEAQRRGLRVLLDGRDIDLPYQLGGTVARRSYVQRAGDVALRFVRSYVEGLSRVLSDAPLARTLVRDYSRISDARVAAQTVDFYHGVLSYPPWPSVPGIGTVIDQLALRMPEAAALRPEDCVELGPLQELEAQGFLDAHAPGSEADAV